MVGFITSCALSKFPHNIFSGGVISNAVVKPQTRKRVFVFFSSMAPCTVCTLLCAQCVMLSSCCAHCTWCWRCNKLVLLSKCARHTSTLHQDLSAEEKRFVRKLLPDLRVDEIVLKKCLWPLRAQAGPQVHLHCNKFHWQGTVTHGQRSPSFGFQEDLRVCLNKEFAGLSCPWWGSSVQHPSSVSLRPYSSVQLRP